MKIIVKIIASGAYSWRLFNAVAAYLDGLGKEQEAAMAAYDRSMAFPAALTPELVLCVWVLGEIHPCIS